MRCGMTGIEGVSGAHGGRVVKNWIVIRKLLINYENLVKKLITLNLKF